MRENFDFRKPEDQEKFDQLPEEERRELIEGSHEEANIENIAREVHFEKEEIADIEEAARKINEKIAEYCRVFGVDISKFTIKGDRELRQQYQQAIELTKRQGHDVKNVALIISPAKTRGFDEEYTKLQFGGVSWDQKYLVAFNEKYPLPYASYITKGNWIGGELVGLGDTNDQDSYQGLLALNRQIMTESEFEALSEILGENSSRKTTPYLQADQLRGTLGMRHLVNFAEKLNDNDLNGLIELARKYYDLENMNLSAYELSNLITGLLGNPSVGLEDPTLNTRTKLHKIIDLSANAFKNTEELDKAIRGKARLTCYLSMLLGKREGYLLELFQKKNPAFHEVGYEAHKDLLPNKGFSDDKKNTFIEIDPSFTFTEEDKIKAEELNLPWSRIEREIAESKKGAMGHLRSLTKRKVAKRGQDGQESKGLFKK